MPTGGEHSILLTKKRCTNLIFSLYPHHKSIQIKIIHTECLLVHTLVDLSSVAL